MTWEEYQKELSLLKQSIRKGRAKMNLPMLGAKGFTFGCDPELFVLDPDGYPVTAEGLFPGTKEEPYPVPGGAWQVDGMAAEFNIDPADNFEDFNNNINKVLLAGKKFLPKGHSFSKAASIRFRAEEFDSAPDCAKTLGCVPDYNAWTGEINPPPSLETDPYLRCAAGHVHIGWGSDMDLGDLQHILNCQDLTKQLDWFLGSWSIRLDKDTERRKLYGKAGAYRPKPYGVEYRVLSNFWLMTKDRRIAMWNRLQSAVCDMSREFLPELVNPMYNEQLVQAINETKKSKELENTFRYPIVTVDNRW